MQTGLEQARQFLARVLPWPGEGDEPAYGNIHWTFQGQNYDKPGWGGRACRSVADAIKALEFALKGADTRDIYFCTSTQRQAQEKTGKNDWKYLVAIRNQQNAVRLKALFLDIDFKGGEHGYDSQDEALTSLSNFLRETGLPRPTMLVSSGGGVHVYWLLVRALTPAEWTPLAYALAEATKQHGLKCDTQVTIDCARVLRVPNTANHKTTPPRPVTMGTPLDFDYLNERIEQALEPYKVAVPQPAAPPLPPRTPLQGTSELAAGVEMTSAAPVKLDDVAKECGFIREALARGGMAYTNPLWNLTTLIATFTEGARADAHRMANQHPGYTQESTDELFDRKMRERQAKGLGWPQCQTISASGCTACQSCPHFGKGKSPLNFAPKPPPPPPPPAPNVLGVATGDLPQNYARDANGVICRTATDPLTGITTQDPICTYPMTTPWLQKNPWTLNFMTVIDEPKQITIEHEIIGTPDMRRRLQAQGFFGDFKVLTEFFVAWIDKLKATRDAVINTTPFGWQVHGGKVEGFVYGGQLWTPTGTRVAPSPDPITAHQYSPTGELASWQEAAELITSQGRPGLDAILASSFGAPLARFTGQPGLMMSVYSLESGIGKSSAMKVAQAVWGDPVRGMQGLSDTVNSVMNKIGEIRSLPLFWDELKTDEDTKRFVSLTFQMTSGKEKSRLTQSAKQRQVGTWQTILISASNESLVDRVVGQTKMTTAGIYRIFEYEVAPGKQGQIAQSQAARILARLNDNYGQAGQAYAKFLGENFDRVDKEVGEFLAKLEEKIAAHQEERFWTSLITCVVMGARYANELGLTQIDEEALYDFMIDVFRSMRAVKGNQAVDMKNKANVSNLFQQFLNANRAKHTLLTNRIHRGRGKPAAGAIKVVGDINRLDGVYVQIGMDDKTMRVSSTYFSDWMDQRGYSRHLATKALEDEFGMQRILARIGAGTPFSGSSEYLLEFDLSGTPLLNFIDEA